jgi:hypothetical protein
MTQGAYESEVEAELGEGGEPLSLPQGFRELQNKMNEVIEHLNQLKKEVKTLKEKP